MSEALPRHVRFVTRVVFCHHEGLIEFYQRRVITGGGIKAHLEQLEGLHTHTLNKLRSRPFIMVPLWRLLSCNCFVQLAVGGSNHMTVTGGLRLCSAV